MTKLVAGTDSRLSCVLMVPLDGVQCYMDLCTSSVLLNGMSLVFLVTFLVALFANLVLEVHYKSF